MRQRLLALAALHIAQLLAQRFRGPVGSAARLALLLDLHQGAAFRRGCPLLGGFDVSARLGQVGAEGLLLTVLLGSALFQLAKQLFDAGLGAGVRAALCFELTLNVGRGGLGPRDVGAQRFCCGFPLGDGLLRCRASHLGLLGAGFQLHPGCGQLSSCRLRRLVPASTEMMVELMNYRRSLELSDLPAHGEPSPLLFPVAWRRSSHPAPAWPERLTRSAVHGIIKDTFAQAAERWLREGRGDAQAEKLKSASAHWLRHTAGSNLANDIDLRHVRDTLGHASLGTTSIYVHGEDDARHAAISTSHRVSWDAATAALPDTAP